MPRPEMTDARGQDTPFWAVQGRPWHHPDTMRLIRRYSNRKLYDTQKSHYVTLAQVAAFIRDGDEIKVLDHDTHRDITALTMAQILFEEEKRASRIGPRALRTIIQTGELP